MNNNKLLNSYNKMDQNAKHYTENKLLQNSQVGNNFYTQQQGQLMKKLRNDGGFDALLDKDKVRESVIRPIKIEKSKSDKKVLRERLKQIEGEYIDKEKETFGPEIQRYWKNRTNETYKGIIKGESRSLYKDKDDLIVHKVSVKDKEGVDKDYKCMGDGREKHNDELKIIYSTDQENEHKKTFEYNHVYKYRVQYDPKGHDKLKKDKIKYYKERQQKEEEGKQNIDCVIENLIAEGIFNEEELNSMGFDLSAKNLDKKDVIKQTSDNIVQSSVSSKKQAYLDRKKKV